MGKLCLFCPTRNYIIKRFRRNEKSPSRKMSVQSLPQLSISDGLKSSFPILPPARRKKSNSSQLSVESIKSPNQSKYNSLPLKPAARKAMLERQQSSSSKLDEVLQKRQRINRNGSIGNLNFRGIKKKFLEKQTSMIAHSMTVGGFVYRLEN